MMGETPKPRKDLTNAELWNSIKHHNTDEDKNTNKDKKKPHRTVDKK